MKVRISYTVTVDDEFRRALRSYVGDPGLATREEIKQWYKARGGSCDEDMLYQYHCEQKKAEEQPA